tara:strand:+ start:3211 stop:3522 length:312 start_codon:yes stop_codon:yes gene_type:complete
MIPLPEIPYDPWFNEPHNPLDDMPIATNDRFDMYGSSDADDAFKPQYSSRHESTPEFEKTAEEVVTMHEKMYRIATAKYNPFAIGGSESIHDFEGGSERCQKK